MEQEVIAVYNAKDTTKTKDWYQAAFRNCCINENIEIAKWLYSLNCIDIHEDDEFVFRYSCEIGDINMAKWLDSLDDKINIHTYKYAFINCCCRGQLEVVKWLYSLNEIIDINNEWAFESSCILGNIQIMKWALLMGRIRIGMINEWGDYMTNEMIKYIYWHYDFNKLNNGLQNKIVIYKQKHRQYVKKVIRMCIAWISLYNNVCHKRYQVDGAGYYDAKDDYEQISKNMMTKYNCVLTFINQ